MRDANDAKITITPGYRLQWEAAQDCHVLLYPEGMIKLNQSASEILSRLNGEQTTTSLIRELKAAFPEADLEQDVLEFVQIATTNGWITIHEQDS
jgi:pyrroloquinoline quinone biosynthesis protein D